ncbi:MBL fold metallo-hydrolase [Methylobacter sp.]|uniref:MBL fold metallo-hydrolase n=1 Tax=Methylobacter sp. TaxID=2051955 RepID=UPI002FDD19AD
MLSKIHTIKENLYVNSVYIDKLGLSFNQFILVSKDNIITIIETGFRKDFDELYNNMKSIGLFPENIQNIIVPHFEADEMGALPEILKISQKKLNIYAHPICTFGLNDIFNTKAKPVKDSDIISVFEGCSLKFMHTQHVHQWDSLVVYWIEQKILFSSDLFIQGGEFTGINTNNCIAGIVNSIKKDNYLPSHSHLINALNKIKENEIDIIFPMHGSGLSNNINFYIDSLINLNF